MAGVRGGRGEPNGRPAVRDGMDRAEAILRLPRAHGITPRAAPLFVPAGQALQHQAVELQVEHAATFDVVSGRAVGPLRTGRTNEVDVRDQLVLPAAITAFELTCSRLVPPYVALARTGHISRDEALGEALHLVWQFLAPRLGLRYDRSR